MLNYETLLVFSNKSSQNIFECLQINIQSTTTFLLHVSFLWLQIFLEIFVDKKPNRIWGKVVFEKTICQIDFET